MPYIARTGWLSHPIAMNKYGQARTSLSMLLQLANGNIPFRILYTLLYKLAGKTAWLHCSNTTFNQLWLEQIKVMVLRISTTFNYEGEFQLDNRHLLTNNTANQMHEHTVF